MLFPVKPIIVQVLSVAVLIYLRCVSSLSSSPSLLSSSNYKYFSKPFSTFQFAENGVCTEPYWFVCEEQVQAPTTINTMNTSDDSSQASSLSSSYFTMRNVPGTGDCMFLAVALATATSMGLGANNVLLNKIACETRAVVAQVLGSNQGGTLHIEGKRLVRTRDLLLSAAKQEGLAPSEYIESLKVPGTEGGLYGGGPELTVLSNILRRPISIYELEDPATNSNNHIDDTKNDNEGELSPLPTTTASVNVGVENVKSPISICKIKRVGIFGDIFQDPLLEIPESAVLKSGLQEGAYSWHLRILIVNAGNEKHACALLPRLPTMP